MFSLIIDSSEDAMAGRIYMWNFRFQSSNNLNYKLDVLINWARYFPLSAPYPLIEAGPHTTIQYSHGVRALSRHHPSDTTSKLHPHHTTINFPPQANNKAALLRDTEVRILNLGPKFVPPAPEQVLERLPKEIGQMKEKVSAAWRRVTKTLGRQAPIVDRFCERIEDEIRKTVTTEAPTRDPTLKPAIKFFLSNKRILQALLDKLRPSLIESELPHLYYNPKDHKINEPLRPIVSGMKSPLAKLSSFLDKNIRPLFDRHTPYSTSNSMIFLKRLKEFKTTNETNMYTFDVTDLYTMIPQKESVLAVCEFLGRYGYKKVCGLAINTIKDLFLHVLENSYFVLQLPGLKPKYYQQIRGGAMGSACTQVLADIYIRKWKVNFRMNNIDNENYIFDFEMTSSLLRNNHQKE
ncbi:unnamed protein product [Rotaria magnacalcarata]|uniref:Reverse transcriptase domain-containing protein n=1 Tax=Rotaria magnacalcarata TaxID=392030 RepID=A0A819RTA9_9BILA|nr:unnamed protein product [Rotaria magnacalcarata]